MMRKSKEVTVVYTATFSKGRRSSRVWRRRIKKKKLKNKKGWTVSYLSPSIPFSSSLMSTSRTLVLQMFLKYCHRSLLHSVTDYWKWFDVFTLRWEKKNKKLEKRHIVYSLRYKSSVIASTKLCSCARL